MGMFAAVVEILVKKRILVTGATGFIGSNLVRRLIRDKNNSVSIFVRKKSNLWRIADVVHKLKLIECDLSDKEKTQKIIKKIRPNIVYHCASYGAVSEEKEVDMTVNTNIIATINLINACIENKPDAFINLSSSSEYGPKSRAMKEDDELRPLTHYGAAKAVSTFYLTHISKLNKFPAITFRLFSPFGYYESNNRLFPSLMISVVDGKNPQLASPFSSRDFIFIEDVVDLLIKAPRYAKKHCGEIFNVGTGKQCTVKHVANSLISLSGKNLKPVYFSLEKRSYDSTFWVADMNKTFKTFNWRPKYSLEKSLKILLSWFKENRGLY